MCILFIMAHYSCAIQCLIKEDDDQVFLMIQSLKTFNLIILSKMEV